MDAEENWMGLDGYESMYSIYSHCLSYVALSENNSIGALVLFAATAFETAQKSSTYAEVCYITNKAMFDNILLIFGTRLRKPSWMK